MNGVRRTGVNGVSVAPFGRLSAAIEALVRVTSAWHIACPHLETGLFEFLKRPDKLTIVEFPIATTSGEVRNFVGYRAVHNRIRGPGR
jgi:glutamate dehydrogenase/leucine dehydrogenase